MLHSQDIKQKTILRADLSDFATDAEDLTKWLHPNNVDLKARALEYIYMYNCMY